MIIQKQGKKPFQTLPEIVYIALTDKEDLSRENCLDEFSMKEMQEITNAVSTALKDSLPTAMLGKKKGAVKE